MHALEQQSDTMTAAVWDQEIVNPAIVRSLKRRIASKHPDRDAAFRAAVLADALHRIVQNKLPAFADEDKVALRLRLVQRLCKEGNGRITERDVLLESLLKDERPEILTNWVAERTGTKPPKQELLAWQEAVRAGEPLPFERVVAEGQSPPASFVPPELRQGQLSLASESLEAVTASPAEPSGYRWSTAAEHVPGWFRYAACVFLLAVLAGLGLSKWQEQRAHARMADSAVSPAYVLKVDGKLHFMPEAPAKPSMENGLPAHYQFTYLNTKPLQKWLDQKQSLLADEPYFSTLLQTAQAFNLHPYMLFAVAGQENGFVKADAPDAEKMANNPFNVYHSWWEYNTTIADTSRIAAKTIVRLSWDQPKELHPLQWINREYAEDPNWWKGVKAIFEQMEREIDSNE